MRDTEYDLLTAALIGAAVGAGITILLHHLPGGSGGGLLERFGQRGDAMVERGARHGRKWGADKLDDVSERVDGAKEALRDAVEREVVRGVRRAVLRQRKRFGL